MSETIYTHKHHIIPKHAGGTDDPSNIIELTVEEHAEAHRKLYEEYGRWQDKVAWLGLSGQIGQEEIIRMVLSESKKGKKKSEETRRRMSESKKGTKHSDKTKIKISESMKGERNPIYGRGHSVESKRKMSESSRGKKHSDRTKIKISESGQGKRVGTDHWSWVAHTYG